ncbi:MAG: YbcC family protein [Pseudomonadota bacterium]
MTQDSLTKPKPTAADIAPIADAAARAIPPVWPLASSVAVNPYLGQAGLDLATTAALLARVSDAPATMARSWYRERIGNGSITDGDLAAALAACTASPCPASVAELKLAAQRPHVRKDPLPTIADLAARVSGIDWPAIIAERLGHWIAGWSDEGQALWAAPQGKSAFRAWQDVATHDLTPEIAGLKGFARFVADAPDSAADALAASTARLGLPDAAMPTYFHALLMTLGGWAQVGRYRLWQAELAGQQDSTLTDLLCIRLMWEDALLAQYRSPIHEAWQDVVAAHSAPVAPDADQIIDAILQEAAERAGQRAIGETLAAAPGSSAAVPPALQAAFCIDVRSEVFRRALEALDPSIQTLGFAGFFGLGASHRRFASDVHEHRLPVLLNPKLTTSSGGAELEDVDRAARYRSRAKRAWGRFKLAAVSSFAFVEAAGPVYLGKLMRDSFALKKTSLPNDPMPRPDPALSLADKIDAATAVLRAMSLTQDFAPLVLLVGHGANVVNNPHASGLHCGACGGYSGEVNARLLASLLNEPAVRGGLASNGIIVPSTTLFLAGLHDTTTDNVLIYDGDHPSPAHANAIDQARGWLASAGLVARGERALRLPRADGAADVAKRSRDWAEIRPEWALAGCKAFIAAPRSRTSGKCLEGRAFLHDYQWQQDEGFGVLELIMTAPVVVASWISLQYYGSSVAPHVFGGGNKLIHNVTGGIGVVEGNGGTLRAGLPWQSVHDGSDLVHEPLRLSVCIEAPVEAMTAILERHEGVRALFDNRWLHLFALNAAGELAWRYTGNLQWERVDGQGQTMMERDLAA